jgi:hypothetical protein
MSGVGTQEGVFRALAGDPTLSAMGNKRMPLVHGALFFAGNPAALCEADRQGWMSRNLSQYKAGLRVSAKSLMAIDNANGSEEHEAGFRKRGPASASIQGVDVPFHQCIKDG